MPIYEYLCPQCHTKAEALQSMREAEEEGLACTQCETTIEGHTCDTPMERIISSNQLVIWKDGQYRGSYDQEIRRNPGAIRD